MKETKISIYILDSQRIVKVLIFLFANITWRYNTASTSNQPFTETAARASTDCWAADGAAVVTAGASPCCCGCCWPSSLSVRADSSLTTHPLHGSAAAAFSPCRCWPALAQQQYVLVGGINNLVQTKHIQIGRLFHIYIYISISSSTSNSSYCESVAFWRSICPLMSEMSPLIFNCSSERYESCCVAASSVCVSQKSKVRFLPCAFFVNTVIVLNTFHRTGCMSSGSLLFRYITLW